MFFFYFAGRGKKKAKLDRIFCLFPRHQDERKERDAGPWKAACMGGWNRTGHLVVLVYLSRLLLFLFWLSSPSTAAVVLLDGHALYRFVHMPFVWNLPNGCFFEAIGPAQTRIEVSQSII